jgi:diacylglycerol kinase family enzyme
MYCYLYDELIHDNKKYEKEVLRIENRLTDLGITGKTSRLALFRNAEEMIRDEVDRGVSTVVILGNDDTVKKILNVLVESDVVLGLIPIGPNNELAKLLGVPEGLDACDVLSARRVEEIDVGTINNRRFLTGVSISDFKAELMCNEGKYRIAPTTKSKLLIRNLDEYSDPCDGMLSAEMESVVKKGVLFKRNILKKSILPFKSLAIRSDRPITVLVDGDEMEGTRFDVGIEPNVLKVITGKERVFAS